MLLASTILVMTLAFVALPSGVGAEPVIQGTVVNKTGGVTPVKNQEVELKAAKTDGLMESVGISSTDDLGNFSFANVAGTGALTYTVYTKFQGVEYQTVITTPLATSSTARPELVVYEPTNEANVEVELSHLVIEVDPTTRDLTVLEIALVSNNSDKTFVSSSKDQSRNSRTLWFPLPKGALHPDVSEGLDEVTETSGALDGLGYSGPVLPGQKQVIYSYVLANPGPTFTISKPLAYPTRKVNVLVSDVGEKIAGPKLASDKPVNFNNRTYLRLIGEAFEATDSLQFSVSDFPPSDNRGPGLGSSDELKWVALGLLILAGGALVLVYPKIRTARQES